jgi:hypothetical protein
VRPLARLATFAGVLVLAASGPAVQAQIAPDSAVVAAPVVAPLQPDSAGPSPSGAVVRAIAVPGWGQVYTGQWLKAPFAVAGVAGAVSYLVFNQRRYVLYRRATLLAGCQDLPGDPETDPGRFDLCQTAEAEYQDEWDELNNRPFGTLAPIRDRARGSRDIAVVVVGLAYAVQALDAYIAAELADFDVSEDLAVGLAPTSEGGLVALRVRL